MSLIRRVWVDPVWSKVIAGAILALCTSLAIIIWAPIKEIALYTRDFVTTNFFVLTTAVLAVVLLYTLRGKRRSAPSQIVSKGKKRSPQPLGGIEWLDSLTEDELSKYAFLVWFPLNRSLKTQKYFYNSESLDHIPEIEELIRRRVIRIQREDMVQFTVRVESDIYKYFEDLLQRSLDGMQQQKEDNLQSLRGSDLGLMLRGRSSVRE